MYAPEEGSSTSSTQIEVTWQAITSNAHTGGGSIISYQLDWDQGTSSWTDLQGLSSDSTALTYTISSGLTAGTPYEFRLRAKNSFGWGPYSLITTIIPVSAPGTMNTLSTSIVNNYVKLDWAVPPSTNGGAITAYEVVIRQSDGTTFSTETTTCDGADSIVVSNAYCMIPMTTLSTTPFALTYGTTVIVKAKAQNSKGWAAAYSTENSSGATIETVPA